jgi:hypothetical protein
MIKGPLSDDDLLDLVQLMQRIEAKQPDEEFHMIVDSPQTDLDIEAFYAKVPPLPGYGRDMRFIPRSEL